ncbi:unnamed protein product [Bemisia tabaci]|uniref:Ubiquitin carboxyl-terminal hydrolase n=1 Tax=Bemisia tabaci TaxID=7038 RepID=A0A9P0AKB3_BEMTA|nr:unnamed protein product [Bemisia tabaci]
MPVDINRLTEGWLELESDPGLFTLLLEDFGVKGVQVEEIYDLQKPIDGPVYGFIFLFRWIEERRSRRKVIDQSDLFVKDEEVVNNIFFAQQMVPNSCATHSLLSVLLNCPNIHLGETLSRLKAHTSGMCPENKGWAIGNTPELAKAHNSHAMPQAKRRLDKSSNTVSTGRYTGEAFHFVSYVAINGRLFELDGLKPYPMDHGPWCENEDWTDKFRNIIGDRLGITDGSQMTDIRFNLMAVVPDRRLALTYKLNMLKTNRQIVLEALQQLVKSNRSTSPEDANRPNSSASETSKKDSSCEEKEQYNLDSSASIEDVLDLATPNKIQANYMTPSKNLNSSDPSGEKSLDKDTSIASDNQNNLSKISLVITPPENQTDYSLPLTIQTSPAPSTSSTDTSSEVGSAFNSPGQSSPTCSKDFKKFVVIRVALGGMHEDKSKKDSGIKKVCLEAGALPQGWEKPPSSKIGLNFKTSPTISNTNLSPKCDKINESDSPCKKTPEAPSHTFAPKDLLALVKSLEGEISICEGNLRDENEKRKKYKIDDCRRTHNYDEFICTFLSMLAHEGTLADLVLQQQQCFIRKQHSGAAHSNNSLSNNRIRIRHKNINKKKKAGTKYRKRK